MNNEYSLNFNLIENPYEIYCISKYISEDDKKINPKIIGAVIELLVNGYLENASEDNISKVLDLLVVNQNEEIDWKNAREINDMLEKYF